MAPLTPDDGQRWLTLWTGGGYPDREGVEVTGCPDGILIRPWYDGGIHLANEITLLPWDLVAELDAIRRVADHEPDPR